MPRFLASLASASKSASVPYIGSIFFVVGNVVAEVHLRRREAGRDPDRVHAEIFQVIQLRRDAVEVADAVVVAVGKAARIDLIEHRVLPPLVSFGIDGIL